MICICVLNHGHEHMKERALWDRILPPKVLFNAQLQQVACYCCTTSQRCESAASSMLLFLNVTSLIISDYQSNLQANSASLACNVIAAH